MGPPEARVIVGCCWEIYGAGREMRNSRGKIYHRVYRGRNSEGTEERKGKLRQEWRAGETALKTESRAERKVKRSAKREAERKRGTNYRAPTLVR
jgi:hypothetical protein